MSHLTTAEQRSSFMKWAAQRIAREVEENEKIENLTGSRDIIPQRLLTKQQKLHLVKAIDEQRDTGLSVLEAAKIHGVTYGRYVRWRRVCSLGRYVKK